MRGLVAAAHLEKEKHRDSINSLLEKEEGDGCVVTGLFFPTEEAARCITITGFGPM